MEESEQAVDSGEMGATNEEKDDSIPMAAWWSPAMFLLNRCVLQGETAAENGSF